MDVIVLVFVGVMCMYQGVVTFHAKERNRVFTKLPIEVVDVKQYNHFCGGLIIGFGVVAEITIFFVCTTQGLLSIAFTLLIIVEAFLTVAIYRKVEKKMLKKR